MKKIRIIVERIIAKAKQHIGTIKGIVSAQFGSSPLKSDFVDMHKEQEKPKKFWHFNVNNSEQTKAQEEQNMFPKIGEKIE
jgi:hypothetical protein